MDGHVYCNILQFVLHSVTVCVAACCSAFCSVCHQWMDCWIDGCVGDSRVEEERRDVKECREGGIGRQCT